MTKSKVRAAWLTVDSVGDFTVVEFGKEKLEKEVQIELNLENSGGLHSLHFAMPQIFHCCLLCLAQTM